jgi:hypothetical protein
MMVWICEYPYRTIRADGPCADCLCGHANEDGLAGSAPPRTGAGDETPRPVQSPRVLPFRDTR